MAIANLAIRISAQISELQKGFAEAKDAVEKFEKGVVSTGRTVASVFGVGLSAAAIVGFVRNVINAASEITALSNQLGISTTAVQKFQFIAGQTGTTIEAFGKAAFVLGTNLTSGDASTVAGVERLGLSLGQLSRVNPEQKLDLVISALGRMGSATERNTVLTQIFGAKLAQELAKAAAEYDKLKDKAPAATEASVKALTDAGNKVAEFQSKLSSMSILGLGAVIKAAEGAEVEMNKWAAAAERGNLIMPGLIGEITRYNAVLRETASAAASAAAAQNAAFGRAPSLGQPGLKPAGNLSFNELLGISSGLEKAFDATVKARKVADEYAGAVKQLRDQLSGAALQAEVRKLSDAFAGMDSKLKSSAATLDRVGDAAQELRDKGAQLTPQLRALADQSERFREAQRRSEEVVRGSVTALDEMRRATSDARLAQERLLEPLRVSGERFVQNAESIRDVNLAAFRLSQDFSLSGWFSTVSAQAETATVSLGTKLKGALKENLEQIPQILASAFTGGGGIMGAVKAVASLVGAAIGQAIGTAIGGPLGGAIGAALGSLAGPLVGQLAKIFDRNKGRDLVKDFVAGFGGFADFQRKLQETFDPATAERYWIALTQGVGRNSPEQAKKIIDELNEAFGLQASRLSNAEAIMEEYGFSFEDAGQKFRNAKLAEQFDALFEKTLTLKEVGIDYDEILRRQASQYSELLRRAIATNTEIDSSMRPVLERMAELGLLTDAASGEFLDLNNVQWSKTLTQGFKDVTDAIKELPRALSDVFSGLDSLSKRRVTIPVGFDVQGGGFAPTDGGVSGGVTQTINVRVGDDVIASAAARGFPSNLELNGV